jgi:hypothetical protein
VHVIARMPHHLHSNAAMPGKTACDTPVAGVPARKGVLKLVSAL